MDAYDEGNPVIIYARITKGGQLPVIDAHVKATIFKPGGDLEASSPLTFILRDNGAGYPDITAGDGIYSAYFADYATVPGLYTIRVVADNNDGLARTPKVSVAFTSSIPFNSELRNKTPNILGTSYVLHSSSIYFEYIQHHMCAFTELLCSVKFCRFLFSK